MGDGSGPHSGSGTRLKVTRYAGADGSSFVQPEAFDSTLGFSCKFLRATDGSMRCFPASFGQIYYTDDACSIPIAAMGECQTGSERHITHLVGSVPGLCPSRSHRAFALSAEDTAFQWAYIDAGGDCVRLEYSVPIMLRELTEIRAEDLALVNWEADPL